MEVKLPCMKFQNLSITLHYITLPTLTSCPLPLLCATSRSNCPWALLLGPLSRDKTCFYITSHDIILYSNCITQHKVLYCVIISPWTWSTKQGQDPGHRVSFNICRVRFFEARKNMSLSLYLPEWVSCDIK